jgi:hypothetical protein
MAATTGPIDVPERKGDDYVVPVKAATKINLGSLVVWDAGFAAPGRVAVGLLVAGRAEETVDNTAGAAGVRSVRVRRGVFKYTNEATDLCAQANVGADGFMSDDQSIAKTNGGSTRSRAGRIVQVDSDGVWIDTRY